APHLDGHPDRFARLQCRRKPLHRYRTVVWNTKVVPQAGCEGAPISVDLNAVEPAVGRKSRLCSLHTRCRSDRTGALRGMSGSSCVDGARWARASVSAALDRLTHSRMSPIDPKRTSR